MHSVSTARVSPRSKSRSTRRPTTVRLGVATRTIVPWCSLRARQGTFSVSGPAAACAIPVVEAADQIADELGAIPRTAALDQERGDAGIERAGRISRSMFTFSPMPTTTPRVVCSELAAEAGSTVVARHKGPFHQHTGDLASARHGRRWAT